MCVHFRCSRSAATLSASAFIQMNTIDDIFISKEKNLVFCVYSKKKEERGV